MFQAGNDTCKRPEVPKSLHVQGTKNGSLQEEHSTARETGEDGEMSLRRWVLVTRERALNAKLVYLRFDLVGWGPTGIYEGR